MIKILHTSDLHLGAKLGWLGNKSISHRQKLLSNFQQITNLAIEKQVDIFLIAGDLFDSPFPSLANVAFVKEQLGQLAKFNIFTVIISGNHDRAEPRSVFATEKFLLPANGRVVSIDKPEVITHDGLGLNIFAIGQTKQFSNSSPLKPLIDLYPANKGIFNIAVTHGAVNLQGHSSINYPIAQEEIMHSEFDYIALGDWHGMLDVSRGKTKAWYSGAPEVLAVDQQNSGSVLYIEIDNGKTTVEPVKVSTTNFSKIEISLNKIYEHVELNSREDFTSNDLNHVIIEQLISKSSIDQIGIVEITGKRKLNHSINIEEITNYLHNRFYFLKIKDSSFLELSHDELAKYPEEMIVGRFINELKKEIKEEKDPDRVKLLEEVLQEGVKRLLGN